MPHPLMRTLLAKLRRDRALPWTVLLERSLRYAWELTTAQMYLRSADVLGHHVRTLGRPRIDNLGRLEIGGHTLLRSINVPVELGTSPHGLLRIGDYGRLNYGVSIYASAYVSIGHRVRIGPYAMIVDTDFHDPYQRSRRPPGSPVVIEADVWVGAKASILKGVTIGRGAIVGTGAVVTRSVAPFSIVAGVPARTVATLDQDRFVEEDVA